MRAETLTLPIVMISITGLLRGERAAARVPCHYSLGKPEEDSPGLGVAQASPFGHFGAVIIARETCRSPATATKNLLLTPLAILPILRTLWTGPRIQGWFRAQAGVPLLGTSSAVLAVCVQHCLFQAVAHLHSRAAALPP